MLALFFFFFLNRECENNLLYSAGCGGDAQKLKLRLWWFVSLPLSAPGSLTQQCAASCRSTESIEIDCKDTDSSHSRFSSLTVPLGLGLPLLFLSVRVWCVRFSGYDCEEEDA